jgi:hypothetical protein
LILGGAALQRCDNRIIFIAALKPLRATAGDTSDGSWFHGSRFEFGRIGGIIGVEDG